MVEGNVNVYPIMPREKPQLGDVIGEARSFLDDFLLNLEGKGIFEYMGINQDKVDKKKYGF